MQNFFYENQGTNTYLVYEIDTETTLDTMSLGMLTNNSIPGLASTLFTQMDASKYIKYNVSAKISVNQLFSGVVNKSRLLGVFKGIADALISAEDYMIDENSIVLDLDYVFTDVTTHDTVLICLPVEGPVQRRDLGVFFKEIMFSTQFDPTENCDYVGKILNYLNSNPVFSLSEFKGMLLNLEKESEPAKAAQPQVTPKTSTVSEVPSAAANHKSQQVAAQTNQPQRKVQVQPQVPNSPKFDDLQFGANYPELGGKEKKVHSAKNLPSAAPAAPKEKPMSLFYLLQHYNKDNAAAYKAQQAAKKAGTAQAKSTAKPQKPVTKPVSSSSGSGAVSFAIPGQAASPITPPVKSTPAQPVQVSVNSAPTPVADKQVTYDFLQQPTYTPPQVPQGQKANFGETTVLNKANGETTVLNAPASPATPDPHLIRFRNSEKILLNKPVFRIGKERSYVDYFISDNTAISRGHANVINHSGEFFVMDTNSTNHTYVNGTMIQSGVEVKLSHGDKIRLANEDFEFKMY